MADTTTVTSVGYYGWSNEIFSISTFGWMDAYDPGSIAPFSIGFTVKKPGIGFSVKKPAKTFTVKKSTVQMGLK